MGTITHSDHRLVMGKMNISTDTGRHQRKLIPTKSTFEGIKGVQTRTKYNKM